MDEFLAQGHKMAELIELVMGALAKSLGNGKNNEPAEEVAEGEAEDEGK